MNAYKSLCESQTFAEVFVSGSGRYCASIQLQMSSLTFYNKSSHICFAYLQSCFPITACSVCTRANSYSATTLILLLIFEPSCAEVPPAVHMSLTRIERENG